MSENEKEETTVSTESQDEGLPTSSPETSGAEEPMDGGVESGADLSGLMSSGVAPSSETARPDLDADAMRAAQAAIEEGERALAVARAQLGRDQKPATRPRSKGRELALRMLLAANVLAMLIVMSLPSSTSTIPGSESGSGTETATQPKDPNPAQPVTPAGPRLADKYNQALLASESGEYARAVELLEEYLVESPRMAASRLVNVYRAMAHYSSAIGRFSEAQGYERRAQAVTQSHSLPEDLVASAKAAAESGDQEALRRVWARFLLQQRQIPSSLYQHVAEAYLQLGDSYRIQANDAAEKARLAELKQAEALIREQGK